MHLEVVCTYEVALIEVPCKHASGNIPSLSYYPNDESTEDSNLSSAKKSGVKPNVA